MKTLLPFLFFLHFRTAMLDDSNKLQKLKFSANLPNL